MVKGKVSGEIRKIIRVIGIVQGVGFRPFVYQIAKENDIKGFVINTSEGVYIDAEGQPNRLAQFIVDLKNRAPVLSKIDEVVIEDAEKIGYEGFEIRKSKEEKGKFIPISPDMSICEDCRREMLDPNDRRYRYPFINCTNCGPRFTIIEDIPYDRKNTTMKVFKMCERCQAEYDDPQNRRFHAQPNACPVCGPKLIWYDKKEFICDTEQALEKAIEFLKDGKIVAVKGLGGFHLAVDATNDMAVSELRRRKKRYEKPLAVMMLDVHMVSKYCEVSEDEIALLLDPKKPIVLLNKKENIDISEFVSMNLNTLGVMLPYTPLHHLLLEGVDKPLVMTSGNFSEEPIVKDNEIALEYLKDIVDGFLLHDREIRTRIDDSVARIVKGKEFLIRRARGYAPFPIRVSYSLKEVLAVGAEQKNTVCLTKGNYVFLSQHIGDLENEETLSYFKDVIETYKKLFKINPVAIACDLHPDYISTQYAEKTGLPIFRVQHHHAHIASCMAENNLKGPVIGVSYDGNGYGTDGRLWGSEIMVCDFYEFRRRAHLNYVSMPGGALAIKRPYRMAYAYFYELFGEIPDDIRHIFEKIDAAEMRIIEQQVAKGINCPKTSGMGRLFDAVSFILGIRDVCYYEGQAAVEMESKIQKTDEYYPYGLDLKDSSYIINPRPIFENIFYDLNMSRPIGLIACKFHNTVVQFTVNLCKLIREESGINRVCLSGGVFQNVYLLNRTINKLREEEFEVFYNSKIPTNDGGIALGQAFILNAILGGRN